MPKNFAEIAFTDNVKAMQEQDSTDQVTIERDPI